MSEAPFKILPTDRVFQDSPDAGWPECICSRCGKPIPENDQPIRCWTEDGKLEWRYHPACLGFKTFPEEELDEL